MNPNITKYEAERGCLSVRLKLRDNLRSPLNDMNDRWLRFLLKMHRWWFRCHHFLALAWVFPQKIGVIQYPRRYDFDSVHISSSILLMMNRFRWKLPVVMASNSRRNLGRRRFIIYDISLDSIWMISIICGMDKRSPSVTATGGGECSLTLMAV